MHIIGSIHWRETSRRLEEEEAVGNEGADAR
jgi:hypothetical protein